MSKLNEFIESYNSRIKLQGKKKYVLRLLITTVLQSICLSVIPSAIDGIWDNLYIRFAIMLVIFGLVNIKRYKDFEKL